MMGAAMKTALLALTAIVLLTGIADAHGGRWQGPPNSPPRRGPMDPMPRPKLPGDPPPPPPPPSRTTPPPKKENNPPPTPEFDPTQPPPNASPEGTPRTSRRTSPSSPGLSHWTYWWNLNREPLLQLRKMQQERLAARTASDSPIFLGPGKGRRTVDPGAREARDAIVNALLDAARDGNKDVATGAIIALGKSGDVRATSLLMELAVDKNAHGTVNESAVLALGLLVNRAPDVRIFLTKIAGIRRHAVRTRAFALLGLGYLGSPGAVPVLVRSARRAGTPRDLSGAAVIGMGLLGDEIVVPELSAWLSGRPSRRLADGVLRAHCAAALGMIRSRSALPALLRSLRDRDAEVRRQAVLSLGALLDPEDEAGLKALIHHMGNDKDSQTRAFAAVALGETGAPVAGDALLYAYRKGDSTVVPYAALGMALLARNAESAAVSERVVPVLRKQFADRGSADRRGALAISLGIAGDTKAVKPLLKALEDTSDPGLRAHVAIALGLIGSDEARPALREALREKTSPDLQREAAIALGLLGDREAVTVLDRLVRNGRTEYVRGSAALALGRLATPETAESLRAYLADRGNPGTTRAFVAVALGLVLDRAEVPKLSRIGDHLNHRMATAALIEVLTLL